MSRLKDKISSRSEELSATVRRPLEMLLGAVGLVLLLLACANVTNSR